MSDDRSVADAAHGTRPLRGRFAGRRLVDQLEAERAGGDDTERPRGVDDELTPEEQELLSRALASKTVRRRRPGGGGAT